MAEANCALIETACQEAQLNSVDIIVVESALDKHDYDLGHIPGSVFLPLIGELLNHDFSLRLESSSVENLLAKHNIRKDKRVVVHGENAAIAGWLYWLLKIFDYPNVKILNGGRHKWVSEKRLLTRVVPATASLPAKSIQPKTCESSSLADKQEVFEAIGRNDCILLDVRTANEYTGEWFAESPPKDGQRSGHIPGAVHVPYELTLEPDGRFKDTKELWELYRSRGVVPEKRVICYCAAGFRSAHTWFVLTELLNFPAVKNYSGSWLDWSSDPSSRVTPFVSDIS